MHSESDEASTARVRRELADLAEAPAPPPPPEVSAAVVAALRGNHRVLPPAGAPDRHASRPPAGRRPGVLIGMLAAVAAVGIGTVALTRPQQAAAPRFGDGGITAAHITVQPPAATPPLPVPALRALLGRPPDLGGITDPGACLVSLGRPADTPILGAQPVPDGVLLVLPGPDPARLRVIVVGTGCPAGSSPARADTVLPRP